MELTCSIIVRFCSTGKDVEKASLQAQSINGRRFLENLGFSAFFWYNYFFSNFFSHIAKKFVEILQYSLQKNEIQ